MAKLANCTELMEMSELLILVTQNLPRLRKRDNITQSDVAEKIGTTAGSISRWENSCFSSVSVATFIQLLEYYESMGIDIIRQYRDTLKNKQ